MGERKFGLGTTIGLAVLALVGVSTGLLVFDPRTNGADALRTGGLAAGSVIALYALWLNDRRRRTEEQRQELERSRTELDRDRVADERFARAVELLGHASDQVRVGALHSLTGLARTNPDYTQTVLDVLCSYLRRPFDHPRYGDVTPYGQEDGADEWNQHGRDQAERKLQVRLTAQRLVAELLPAAGSGGTPAYDLDLTNASLEYFDLSDRKVGTLVLRYARLHSSNNFSRCEFTGPVWFTGTQTATGRLAGLFRCEDAVFQERAWFSNMLFQGAASFDRTRFGGRSNFRRSTFRSRVSMVDCSVEGTADFRECAFLAEADLASLRWEGEVWTEGIETDPSGNAVLPAGWRVKSTARESN